MQRIKQSIRNWLTEHFCFVPLEDHRQRIHVVARLAQAGIEQEREIQTQANIIKQLEWERDEALFELEKEQQK